MRANTIKLLEFLKNSPQFEVPIYQRTYSWTNRECTQLWEDIIRTGKQENIPAHFIGSIVFIEKDLYQVANHSLLVIDGQQRLTTVLLIIEALARYVGDTKPLEGFSAKNLRDYYLLDPREEQECRYKLLLTQTDKKSLLALIDQKPWPANRSFRIEKNFEFFENKIRELDKNFAPLCKGLAKLIIVQIALSRGEDNPQLIFESMNSTGRELSQADLIRNFILMGLEQKHQIKLYKNHWRPMEVAFGQEAYSDYFDSFMRDYLTSKTGKIPNVKKVYEAFKEYAREYTNKTEKEIDALVEDIHIFADYFCAIALNKEINNFLKDAFSDLRELKVNVSYPFLLQVYHDYKQDLLSVKEFEYIVRLVESYVFRRAVCDIPTNSLNKTFATLGRDIQKDRYTESVQAQLLLKLSRFRFPKDDEFFEKIQNRDLYNFRNCSYFLRRLENYNRKERVDVNEYTIEHILPQNENLSQKWKQALGPKWKEIQEKYLHTLGNLTLTGYNSEYKDKFFTEKQKMKGGFKKSPLHVNEGLRHIETWGEEDIKERAKQLAKRTVTVWPIPSLSLEVLDNYRPKKQQEEKSSYSIDDHPYLNREPTKSLFEAFQKAVLDLDPCVQEGILKHYIAYRAEKIFVYVKPKSQRLLLFLGLQIYELHDPKKISKDASHRHYGSCKTGVKLHSLEELPYIIGLVRQALEKQISNDNEV
ncbi:MAG: DUF262 and DUF1524 domain-containing protein [Bdellovibrionales bacterium]|nr:DUF262 and DUF1524 domain-containing protein [Bdellovibrionales bacterium]